MSTTAIVVSIIIVLLIVAAVLTYFFVIKKDCKQSKWSVCDPISLTQVRTTKTKPKYGGEECGLLTQDCIPNIDCVQATWSACDPSTSKQYRDITTESSGTGKPCGLLTQDCTPVIDCVQSNWGICNATTGEHSRTTTTGSSGTGKPCGALTESCSISRIVALAGGPMSGPNGAYPTEGDLVYGFTNPAAVYFDVYKDGKAHPLKVTGVDIAIGIVDGTPKFVEYVADDENQQFIYDGNNFISVSNTDKALSWSNGNLVLTGKDSGGYFGDWAVTTLA